VHAKAAAFVEARCGIALVDVQAERGVRRAAAGDELVEERTADALTSTVRGDGNDEFWWGPAVVVRR